MKKHILFIFFALYQLFAFAQVNPIYDINLRKGNGAYQSGKYSSAISYYQKAINSAGVTQAQKNIVNQKIRQCNKRIAAKKSPKPTSKKKSPKRTSAAESSEIRKLREQLEKERLELERLRLAEERRIREEQQRKRNEEAKKAIIETLKQQYEMVDEFREGLARVKKNNKYGYVNQNGILVIPLSFDFVGDFSEGYAGVELNEKYGYIDKTGNIVIGYLYDFAGDFKEGLAAVQQNDKMGFINKTGEIVIPLKYEFAQDFQKGMAEVDYAGYTYFINKSDACVKDCPQDTTNKEKTIADKTKENTQIPVKKVKVINVISDSVQEDDKYADLLIDKKPASENETKFVAETETTTDKLSADEMKEITIVKRNPEESESPKVTTMESNVEAQSILEPITAPEIQSKTMTDSEDEDTTKSTTEQQEIFDEDAIFNPESPLEPNP